MKNSQVTESREYVLQALDKWYASRVTKTYNQDDAQAILIKVLASLYNKDRINLDIRSKVIETLIEEASFEKQFKTASSYFSKKYATIEFIYEQFKQTPPEPIAQKFIQLTFDAYREIDRFVNLVRKRADKTFPDELNETDINNSFIETFDGWRGFAESIYSISQAAIHTIAHGTTVGAITPFEYEFIKELVPLLTQMEIVFSQRNFGDLEKIVR